MNRHIKNKYEMKLQKDELERLINNFKQNINFAELIEKYNTFKKNVNDRYITNIRKLENKYKTTGETFCARVFHTSVIRGDPGFNICENDLSSLNKDYIRIHKRYYP